MGSTSSRIIIVVLMLFFLSPELLLGQQPTITGISPTSQEFGETITITGNNLTGGSTRVFFGSVESENVTVSGTNLLAEVPAGAIQGPITVLANNLIAQSSQTFFLAFGGSSSPSLEAQSIIDITDSDARNVFDICLCDINGDGLNDAVVTHENFDGTEDDLAEYTYFINTTVNSSTTSFAAPVTVNLGGSFSNVDGFVSVECADLDNDGNYEFVFIGSESLVEPVFIFDDITNGVSTNELTLPRAENDEVRNPRGLAINDIDNDGFLDIIIGNGTDNTIHIYRNNGNLTFDNAIEIEVMDAPETESIAVGDLNNDLLPDIAIVPFGSSNENIYLLRNNSFPGAISFLPQDIISAPGQRRNIRIGDFNNDGFDDLATTTNGVEEEVEVFANNSSTAGDLSFSLVEEVIIPTDIIWGIDLGDVNGDGFLDIAVSCVGSGGNGEVYTLENTSSANITFNDPLAGSIDDNSRNIAIGDLNGDAKPDLAYTHNVTQGETDGELGYNINNTCITPEITPAVFSYCSGEDFVLEATNTPNGTYNWSGVTPESTSGNSATFRVTSNADEIIRVEIVQDGCSATETAEITVEFAAGSTPTAPTITPSVAGTICAGDPLELSTDNVETYLWTFPDGTTSIEQTISFSEVTSTDAGLYTLSITESGSCSSEIAEFLLQVESITTPIIQSDGDLTFCDNGGEPTLETESISGFTYQWKRDGTNIGGAIGTSISADQSGNYSVEVTNNSSGCSNESGSVIIQAVTPPTSIPIGVTETCSNVITFFTASSSGETGFTLEYAWRIDSAGVTLATFTNPDFDYTFTSPTAFNYDVVLITNYSSDEVASCQDEETLVVNVTPPPAISFDQVDRVQKCSAESIDVSVTNSGVTSYLWRAIDAATLSLIDNLSSTSATLSVTTPADVDSVYAIVELMTTVGCNVTDSILIRNFPSDVDINSPDFTSILEFDSALLEESISINLEALNVVSGFSWEPADQIDDPFLSNITFFPQNPSTTVTLTGTDSDGCLVSTSVRIDLDNLRPKTTFSPNGDLVNDCWEILNIGDLGNTIDNMCEVYVFDSRGKNIGIFSDFSAGDNCVWDGNFNGSPVPEGVYYFVLKCSNDSFSQSGSILLAR